MKCLELPPWHLLHNKLSHNLLRTSQRLMHLIWIIKASDLTMREREIEKQNASALKSLSALYSLNISFRNIIYTLFIILIL